MEVEIGVEGGEGKEEGGGGDERKELRTSWRTVYVLSSKCKPLIFSRR